MFRKASWWCIQIQDVFFYHFRHSDSIKAHAKIERHTYHHQDEKYYARKVLNQPDYVEIDVDISTERESMKLGELGGMAGDGGRGGGSRGEDRVI